MTPRDPSEWVAVEAAGLRVVSEALWQAAHARLAYFDKIAKDGVYIGTDKTGTASLGNSNVSLGNGAVAILVESALSFIGLGIKPPDTSLGLLVADGVGAALTRPWLFYFPGLFIIVIALTINFVGDGLRDAFDPTQTRVRA